MLKFLLLALTCLASVTLEAMSITKTKKETAESPAKTGQDKVAVEIAALRALGKLDVEALRECLEKSDFPINKTLPALELYQVFSTWAHRTLLEAAVTMQLFRLRDPGQRMQYQQCLCVILRHPQLDANAHRDDWYGSLHLALHNEDPLPVQTMLDAKDKLRLDLNARGWHGETPLFVAIKNQNHVARMLQEPGVDITLSNNEKIPILHALIDFAGTHRETRVNMLALAERGAEINAIFKGKTALDKALAQFKQPLPWPEKNAALKNNILGLLALGAQINPTASPQAKRDAKALILLLFEDSNLDRIIQLSIEGQALEKEELEKRVEWLHKNINLADTFGMTPLMWAAAWNNLKLAQQLLGAQPDLLKTDGSGNTALHHAVRNGHIEMVTSLAVLEPRAYLIKNCFGRTPVDIAIAAKKSKEMVLILAKS